MNARATVATFGEFARNGLGVPLLVMVVLAMMVLPLPAFESPKLARALYRSTDLNKEIPAGLYAAVAQVLSYIFRVRTLNPTIAARVARPNPQVSGEFDDA